MILDIFAVIGLVSIAIPLIVSLYDWYDDFLNGLKVVEVKHHVGKEEKFFYNARDRRAFIKTMKRYQVKEVK